MLSSTSSFMLRTLSQGCVNRTGCKIIRTMCSAETPKFDTLKFTRPREFVVQVELNRPEKRNAMNTAFWREMVECFNYLNEDKDCRVVVVSGAGKMFTAGIDLTDLDGIASTVQAGNDTGRTAFVLRRLVKKCQETFSTIEKCTKPVIAAIHNACVGAGVDMMSACDIRYCSQDAWFQMKQVDVGLPADDGVLQRFPKIVGNNSLTRELAYSARRFHADEAKPFGFVSRIFEDKETLIHGALDMASLIASKSPIAVQGTKVSLVFSRDHSVAEGLEHIATWNQGMLQSEDLMKAAMAQMEKKNATFSKL